MNRSKIISNTLANGASSIINAIVTLVVTSVLIRNLGSADYGRWSLILSASYSYGYLSMGDLGLGESILRSVSSAGPDSKDAGLTYLTSNSLVASVIGAMSAFGLTAIALAVISKGFDVQNIDHTLVFLAVGLMLIEAMLEILCSVFRGFVEGSNRFLIARAIDSTGKLTWGIFAVVIMANGGGIVQLAFATVFIAAFRLVAYVLASFRLHPPFIFSWDQVRLGGIKEVIRNGLHLNGLKVLSVIYGQMDRTIIAIILSVSVITTYDISLRFLSLATLILTTASSAVVPASAKAHFNDENLSNKTLYLRATSLTITVVVPVCVAVILYAPSIINVWVGPNHSDAVTPARLFLLFPLFSSTNQIGIAMLTGVGKTRLVLRYQLIAVGSNLMLSVLLAHLVGVTGVVLGTLLGNLLVWFPFVKALMSTFDTPGREWLGIFVLPVAFGVTTQLAIFLFINSVLNLSHIENLIALCFTTAVGILLAYFLSPESGINSSS